MSKFEKFITDNNDAFNDAMPNDGHFDRFRDKLFKEEYNKLKKKHLVLKIAAAAVVTVFLAGTFFLQLEKQSLNRFENPYIPNELAEIDYYYSNKINVSLNQLNSLTLSPEEEKIILEELQQMDELKINLINEYNTHNGDERVENAIIMHYETKLRVLNQIVSQLKNVKHQKINNHEKVDM